MQLKIKAVAASFFSEMQEIVGYMPEEFKSLFYDMLIETTFITHIKASFSSSFDTTIFSCLLSFLIN
jgi:hypothetical protein